MMTIALVGSPNCGKTALFNRLTGAQQKVANYAGVTVERKEGRLNLPKRGPVRLVDLPGLYSFKTLGEDERVTHDYMCRRCHQFETAPAFGHGGFKPGSTDCDGAQYDG